LTVGTIALREALAFSVPAIIVGTIGGYAGALLLRSQLYDPEHEAHGKFPPTPRHRVRGRG
jgi:hypothetical protein